MSTSKSSNIHVYFEKGQDPLARDKGRCKANVPTYAYSITK